MTITQLSLENFRNIRAAQLKTLSPRLNVIVGDNGSGKTSLLESIYVLGVGRSFRCAGLLQAKQLIHTGEALCRVIAKVQPAEESTGMAVQPMTLAMQRALHKNEWRLAGEPVKRIVDIAQVLPVQLLNAQRYRLLQQPPEERRQVLNWGLFHVEQSFLNQWQRLQRLLKQRNAALRQTRPVAAEVFAWDDELVHLSTNIHEMRKRFFQEWLVVIWECLPPSLQALPLQFDYMPGWDMNNSLQTLLQQRYARDCQLKYTSVGIQRSDFRVSLDGVDVQYRLSLGQQKLLVTTLFVAQYLWLLKYQNKTAIYLIDDLISDLDVVAYNSVLKLLARTPAQIWLTSTSSEWMERLPQEWDDQMKKMFHVEHGNIVAVD